MSIKPLQYGNIIAIYENRERGPAMLTVLFRRTIVGLEDVGVATVERLDPVLARKLEVAVLAASELLDSQGQDQAQVDDGSIDPDRDYGGNKLKDDLYDDDRGTTPAELQNFEESDLFHQLAQLDHPTEAVYRMLMPEIELIQEGAERANKRSDADDSGGGSSDHNQRIESGGRATPSSHAWGG